MNKKAFFIYALLFCAVAVISPWIGPESITPSDVFSADSATITPAQEIFLFQRIPRVLLALIAGGTLALTGAVFQVLFRNPLVEPFTLGISGSSALGAFITILYPSLWLKWGPFSSVQLFAALGAGACLLLIYTLSNRPEGVSIYTLLLAGVTISIICSGAILLLTYLSDPHSLVVFQHWMMGGIDVIGYKSLFSLSPLLIPAAAVLFFYSKELNHMALNDEIAAGHGVDIKRVRRNVFIGGGVAAASVVSVVGPIGFVGLIVPHAVRRLSGYDQRTVLPCSFFLGGASLALCDAAARTIIAPTELPVGIITAVIGGPLFIRLLVSRRLHKL
ncbi:MAG: iron ABC transporter permease [Candidatus Aminicenantes bacterium]